MRTCPVLPTHCAYLWMSQRCHKSDPQAEKHHKVSFWPLLWDTCSLHRGREVLSNLFTLDEGGIFSIFPSLSWESILTLPLPSISNHLLACSAPKPTVITVWTQWNLVMSQGFPRQMLTEPNSSRYSVYLYKYLPLCRGRCSLCSPGWPQPKILPESSMYWGYSMSYPTPLCFFTPLYASAHAEAHWKLLI